MNTVAIVQCRLGSTRFPNKALADLAGRPLIAHVVERARQIQGLDSVVVAVPSWHDAEAIGKALPSDVPLYAFSSVAESDVLGRYMLAASIVNASVVLRITGDCPMLNPRIAEQVLAAFCSGPGIEYASNIADGYEDGTDVEVFSVAALKWAAREAKQPSDREHVTSWLRRNVKCVTVPCAEPGRRKTSIDTIEDLEYVRSLMEVPA